MENGLINAIAPKETLIDEAVGLGQRVARFAPEDGRSLHLRPCSTGSTQQSDEGLAIEAEAFRKESCPPLLCDKGSTIFIAARK